MNNVEEKKLLNKWSHITNPCVEIPLNGGQPMALNISKILNNQEDYLKKMSTPPEESVPENIDEYEKEMSKNLLIDHSCNNCEYSACEKQQKMGYGTCSVWKEKPIFGLNPNIIFPIIKKVYPTLIAGKIISFPIDKKDDSI